MFFAKLKSRDLYTLNTYDKGLIFALLAMMAVVASSNYLVQFEINEWLTWGAFTYPLSFLVTELVNRFYGPKKARKIAYTGFLMAAALGLLFANSRIASASSLAFLTGQLLDISVFNRLRRLTWWLAPLSASVLASFIDTLIFFFLAFYGEEVSWIKLALGDFFIKLLMDIALLLPFRIMVWKTLPLFR